MIGNRSGRSGLLPVSNNRFQVLARQFDAYYNPKITTSLFQDTAKTTPVAIADPVRVMSDLNGAVSTIYTSDFSAGDDSWTAANGAVAGNIDGIEGRDNCLRLTKNATGGGSYLQKLAALSASRLNRAIVSVYVPAGQTYIDGFRVYAGGTTDTLIYDGSGMNGSWVDIDLSFLNGALTTFRVYAYDGTSPTINTAANGELMYVRAVQTSFQIDAIAPSDAARALSGRSPKSGIRNLLVATEDISNAAWVASSTATKSGTNQFNFPNESALATQTVTRTVTAGQKYTAQWVLSGSGTITLRIRTGGASPEFSVNNITLTSTPTLYTVSHTYSNNQTDVLFQLLRAVGQTATAVTVTDAQLDLGDATPYQRVGTTRADITESGVDNAFSLLFDGSNDYYDTGVQSFGNASLFADAGQEWAVCGWFLLNTNSAVINTIIAKTDRATASERAFAIQLGSVGNFNVRLRGSLTNNIVTGVNNTAVAFLLNWDGSVANMYANSLSPTVCGVGEQTEESVSILIGARRQTPTDFANGRIGPIALIDRSLTTAEIASVMRYLASESGAVIS